MSHFRFNHVFAGLLLLSVLSAFVFPKKTSGIRAHVQGVFYPIAKPARMIASTVRGPGERLDDKRASGDVVAENERLKIALASLTAQVELLHSRVAEGEQFGEVGKHTRRVAVMGNDPAARDSLSVVGNFDLSLLNQPALYNYGLAGRFERAGLSGAQVRLITDRSFSATARFGEFVNDGAGGIIFDPKPTAPPLVEGYGNGSMMVKNLELEEVTKAQIRKGTWVVLEDKDYPPVLMHQKLGRVESVKKRPEAPLFADIEIRPEWNLMALTQVWVLRSSNEQAAMTR
ncbi:MAG TPA: rod shape-determining protein MreC [Tepidisphaeraceae bacterium]|nr:rod shape-determining protein MreC [Tepidisphaeraceae bacterium]